MTICQTVAGPAQSERPTRKPEFIPNVLEPTPGQWAQLDAIDGLLLARVLQEPVEYMDAPALHGSEAEKVLFGEVTSPAGKTTRFAGKVPGWRSSDGIPTAAQESLLFQRLNYSRMRRQQLLHRFGHKRMPATSLRLLLAWVHREMALRDQIVELNMPLVAAMAAKFRRTDLDRNELASEGSLALLRAVDKFDCGRGFKFSTYACRAILKSCSRVSLKTTRYASRFPASYDPAMESGDSTDRKHLDATFMCLEEVREILMENRAELTAREQVVIDARFMLSSESPTSRHPTLTQVGDQIGVTKERVRQIQNRALGKLRSVLEDSFLRRASSERQVQARS